MENSISKSLKLMVILALFIVLWLITSVDTRKLGILWYVVVVILSGIFMVAKKNITRRDIVVAIVLGLISMPSNLFLGVVSIIVYLGGVSVLKESAHQIPLIKGNNQRDILKTIFLAIFVGVILGVLNLYLGKVSGMLVNPSIKAKWFLDAIRAGAAEEIIFRYFFFAICIFFTNDRELSRSENFLCYLIMIVPHIITHFDRSSFTLISMVLLSLLFGLPFAIMQRKHDLSSAIGAHAIVDLIRFCVFGL